MKIAERKKGKSVDETRSKGLDMKKLTHENLIKRTGLYWLSMSNISSVLVLMGKPILYIVLLEGGCM